MNHVRIMTGVGAALMAWQTLATPVAAEPIPGAAAGSLLLLVRLDAASVDETQRGTLRRVDQPQAPARFLRLLREVPAGVQGRGH